MNVGKTLFAQVVEHVPWRTFSRIIERHQGDAGVRTLGCLCRLVSCHGLCADHMARVAARHRSLSERQSSQAVSYMGMKAPPARSTMADALNLRDGRIYHALAQRLIVRAQALYCQEPSILELDTSIYALDSSTIDLSEPVRLGTVSIHQGRCQAAHAVGVARRYSDLYLHQRRQDARCQGAGHPAIEASAFYVMDRGYIDFTRLYAMHQTGAFFVTRAKQGMDARRVYSMPTQRASGVICDQRVIVNGFYLAKAYPEHLRRIRFKDPESGKTLVFLTSNTSLPTLTIAALYKSC